MSTSNDVPTTHGPRPASITLLLLIGLALISLLAFTACEDNRPPSMWASAVDGVEKEGHLASYCWGDGDDAPCDERDELEFVTVLLAPREAPFGLRFAGGDIPTVVRAVWLPAEPGGGDFEGTFDVQPGGEGLVSPPDPGRYNLAIYGDWPDKGEAVYTFVVEVR